jgi:hypothetical protein
MGFMKEMKIMVIENFFEHLNEFLNEIQNVKLYDLETYNKKFNQKETWPGLRSNSLIIENKFLFFLILQNLKKVCFLDKYRLEMFIHLRRNEDFSKDWIHKDNNDYAFLVYLNKTNLDSGTYLYDDANNIVADIKYVQNRFIIYNGSYSHKGYGHFGNNTIDGRLTLNGFLNEIK